MASFFDEPNLAASQTAALKKLLAQSLPTKGNRALILVIHHVNITEFTGQSIDSGDMVLALSGRRGSY